MVNVSNFLQSVLGGAPSQPAGSMFGGPEVLPANTAAMPRQAPMQAPDIPQVQAAPARPRRSLLETIGGISDVLARVGGAEALYQPTLDAREDRGFAQEDRMRQIDMDALKMRQGEQQIQSGDMEIEGAQKAIAANAMRGLKAIQKSGGDITRAWPILAKQAGVDDESAAQLAELFGQDPNAIDGLITTLGGSPAEFGLQPFYAQGEDGKLVGYQLGKDGTIQPITLPDGQTPIDPLKFVDTGNAQVGVGSRSGNPVRILPKGEAPGKAADRTSRERIAGMNNRTRITVAGMKPGPKGTTEKAGDLAPLVESAKGNLKELRTIYKNLNDMGALVSPNRSTGENVLARARASGAGQMLEGTVGTQAQTERDRVNSLRPALMQSLAKATGMTGKQLDSNADVKLFMQTVTDPSKSYEANLAAIDGLERFLDANAKATKPAPAAPSRRGSSASRVQPKSGQPARKAAPKPTVSNW